MKQHLRADINQNRAAHRRLLQKTGIAIGPEKI